MNEIIKIATQHIGNDHTQTVNARELHTFLEVGRDFSNWVKDRIEKYNFVENQDFVCSPVLVSEGRGGQNRGNYPHMGNLEPTSTHYTLLAILTSAEALINSIQIYKGEPK